VPEDGEELLLEENLATDDDEKCHGIINHIGGQHVEIISIERLGKPKKVSNNATPDERRKAKQPRPIKITLKNASERAKILKAAKKLENCPEPVKSIRLKKRHPPSHQKRICQTLECRKSRKGKS
jgi:hypothetical protein